MQPIASKSKKFLLSVALLATVAALAYSVLFGQVKKKNERISARLNDIEQSAKQEQLQSSIKQLLAETAPLREKLTGYRIAKDETALFIELLETVGREVDVLVTIESVEVVARTASPAAEDLRLAVRFEGDWQRVVRFLGLLELLPVEGRVEQALISRKREGSGTQTSQWRGDVTLLALKEK